MNEYLIKTIVESSEKIIKENKMQLIVYHGVNSKKNKYLINGNNCYKIDLIHIINKYISDSFDIEYRIYHIANRIFNQITYDLRSNTY